MSKSTFDKWIGRVEGQEAEMGLEMGVVQQLIKRGATKGQWLCPL